MEKDKAAPSQELPLTQQFCFCSKDISLQLASGGAAPEGLYGRVTLKVNGEYIDYVKKAAPSQEPLPVKKYPLEAFFALDEQLEAMEAKLAAPSQEPVAFVTDKYSRDGFNDEISALLPVGTKLYTTSGQAHGVEKRPYRKYQSDEEQAYDRGWNDCVDEMKAAPSQEPYLNGGTRYKVGECCGDGAIMGLPSSLIGQWVALVDATDNCHMKAAPSQEPAKCTDDDQWNCKYCDKTKTCEALKDPRNFGAPSHPQGYTGKYADFLRAAPSQEPVSEVSDEVIDQWLQTIPVHQEPVGLFLEISKGYWHQANQSESSVPLTPLYRIPPDAAAQPDMNSIIALNHANTALIEAREQIESLKAQLAEAISSGKNWAERYLDRGQKITQLQAERDNWFDEAKYHCTKSDQQFVQIDQLQAENERLNKEAVQHLGRAMDNGAIANKLRDEVTQLQAENAELREKGSPRCVFEAEKKVERLTAAARMAERTLRLPFNPLVHTDTLIALRDALGDK